MSAQGTSAESQTRPRKLGRGLSSLIESAAPVRVVHSPLPHSSAPEAAMPAAAPASPDASTHINIDQIVPNKFQPRRGFDEASLAQLADSIRHSGLMQPIIVRRAGGGGGGYELVAGERRWRAAKLAGLAHIPALVRDLSDEESAEWAIVENVQREDLNPIERAHAFRALTERFGLSHAQIAERAGLDRSSVTNFVRLTELEAQIQEMIGAGRLSFGHGRALLAVPSVETRLSLAMEAAREAWSVRRLERAAASISAGGKPATQVPKGARPASLEDLERRLGEYLGTKVNILTSATGKRGKVVVEFYGLDHFDGLMGRIGFTPS